MIARVAAWSAYGGTIAFLLVFLIAPVLLIIGVGIQFDLLTEALFHPVYREGLINACAVGVVTTAMALTMALPLAWIRARFQFTGRGLAEALLLAPLIMPPFVGALGLEQLLGHYGVLNAMLGGFGWLDPGQQVDWLGQHRFFFVCLLEALHLYPILYLYLAAAFAGIDDNLLEAARGLGAGTWRRLRTIIIPMVMPGIFAGCSIVFIWSFTELGTPLLLGYDRVTPVQIWNGLASLEQDHVPFALVVILLVVVALVYGLMRLVVLGKDTSLATAAKQTGARQQQISLSPLASLGVWACILGIAGLAVAPHGAVALIAFAGDWYGTVLPARYTTAHVVEALSHPMIVPSIANSLSYAAWATLLAGVIGTFIAWTVQRWRPPGARLLDIVAMLPLAVPGIIMAFGFLALVEVVTPLKYVMDPRNNPTLLLIVAYAVRRLPYMVRAVAAGFSQVAPAFEEAAASLGAGPVRRWLTIILPLLRGSLIAGALLTFSFCMLEVADSLILAQQRQYFPITKVIYELVSLLGSGPSVACAFALWAMCFLGLTLALASCLFGGRLSQMMKRN